MHPQIFNRRMRLALIRWGEEIIRALDEWRARVQHPVCMVQGAGSWRWDYLWDGPEIR